MTRVEYEDRANEEGRGFFPRPCVGDSRYERIREESAYSNAARSSFTNRADIG